MVKIQNIKELQRRFSALNNENRLKIIILCQEKARTITELSKLINLSHSKTSENTSILEREGLVEKKRNKDNTVHVKAVVKISNDGLKWE